MKKVKSVVRTIKDLEGNEVPKKLHDYTGEELDQLRAEDPEYENSLWTEMEIAAINNPDNHHKSK